MNSELTFGSWPSPISAASVAAQSLRLSSVSVDGDTVYWVEGRPAEGGRNVLVCRSEDGPPIDLTPPPFNVRTRVHEYGGGAYVADRGTVWFSNFADQRVYVVDGAGAEPRALTSEGAWFYADFCVDRARRRLIAVREDHTDTSQEARTTLVAIGEDGGTVVVTEGRDFYSTPRLSPDGTTLSWICWDHPQMPWDGTELWLADLDAGGRLVDARCVAGENGAGAASFALRASEPREAPAHVFESRIPNPESRPESIYQPGWSTDGELIYATDPTGWWQLVRHVEGQPPVALVAHAPYDSEFGRPQWTFGTATWAAAGRSRFVVSYAVAGVWHLGVVDARTGELHPVDIELEPQEWLAATTDHAYFIGASPRRAPVLARLALDSGVIDVLKESSSAVVDADYLSIAEAIAFPTSDGQTAHAFFYPPMNKWAGALAPATASAGTLSESAGAEAPAHERPPLIAISHGGPTAAAVRTLDLRIQYWTSRGFAVVDVNYGGSSGYGRAYRDRLRGTWGQVDVDDMLHVVGFLADAGRIDRNRTIIRGGSAGGYTTLAALTFHPGVFKAGASYYGVSDLEVLARDTHKFEARYLDTLVGPYPARADEYRARSPIHAIDNLACALILFQGLDDKVVPPNQSAMMADAVRRKGLPVAYVAFEGEQHGFRRAENIVRSLEAELYFYGAVFGFTAADRIAPVVIDNL